MTYAELLEYLENLTEEQLEHQIQVMQDDGSMKIPTCIVKIDHAPGTTSEGDWQAGDIFLW